MLEQAAGLSSETREALAELEQRVVGVDGGRLKLEWGALRHRAGDRVEDLLWWEGDRLVGFLGLYGNGASVELAGMVAPEARGRGIGGALLDAGMSLCRQRGVQKALLIVPRPSAAGASLALRRGGVLDHSEHALALSGPPIAAVQDTALRLRPASAEDLPTVSRLLEVGFGQPAPVDLAQLDTARGRILVVELNQTAVGTLRVIRDGGHGRIYGFVIDRQHQGRGLGRGALARACALLRGEGADRIELEVATDNDRALGLYRSVGFTLITTEDYYALR